MLCGQGNLREYFVCPPLSHALLDHAQICPSQVPTICVRFDHTDAKTLRTLGSIIVNMTAGTGAVDSIEVMTFTLLDK